LPRGLDPHKPCGTGIWQGKRERLVADWPLAVYCAAVNDGGEEAWRQERAMMGRRLLEMPREHRGDPMNIGAIEIMLPTWRHWGQILIDAGQDAEIGEERFAP
jgi:hypothetical protein